MLRIGRRTLRVSVRDPDPGATKDVEDIDGADADRPPLLLCNGAGAGLDLLQPFVDAVDPRRRIIRFDLPGIGGSPQPVVPYHLATLPALLAGLLDRLGHRRVDVLGVSWGGALAQQFALRHPGRVRRLVLVATSTGSIMVPAGPRVLRHMLTPRRYHDRAYVADISGELYGGSMRDHPAQASRLLHSASHSKLRHGYYYQLLAGAGWSSLPLLPLLRRPTLVMAGDDDPLTPLVNARIMHRLIPHSELHTYHGGHLDLIAEPQKLAPIVDAFLDDRR